MKQHRKISTARLFAWFTIALMAFMLFNESFFLHSHITPCGKVIAHAHPFDTQNDNEPIKSHQHTAFDFVLLQQFFVFIAVVWLMLWLTDIIVIRNNFDADCVIITAFSACFKSWRAPPSFSNTVWFCL